MSTEATNVNAMTQEMQEELAIYLISYVHAPSDHDIAQFATTFATQYHINIKILKKTIQDIVTILSTSLRKNLHRQDLVKVLVDAGMDDSTAEQFGAHWNMTQNNDISKSVFLAHAELIEMKWKLGIVTATNTVGSIGTPFVRLSFVLKENTMKEEKLELSLAMFYQFLANMEALKEHMTYLKE
ncbi:hypothetical protein THRCLA_08258 [Thraustotheca clavata]|uniref:COMM domain-containing protein n=1 Tax=Thraustotheca clavata TaxID=74557 RepID=A0A1V9Z7T8_9STRA|nr:hypothetical protein THRCLA_08258 [Thraustotheca clavata]